MKNRKTEISFAALGLSMALIAGCASVQIPPEQVERSAASMRTAEEVGANRVPSAKLHLQLATEQFAKAKSMEEMGDKRAAMMMSRAEADSELALAMVKRDRSHRQATAAKEDLAAVKNRNIE